ncbi:MAG: PQQ-binding-like beta-propeller repeat protein [Thermoguttaceae bacterium]|jgi:outer membrane protein assembly factor BamB
MIRRSLYLIALLAAWQPCALWAQSDADKIIPQGLAARHGLTRAWFTQVEMDPGRSRLKDLVLYDGILYAQTDRAMVHAVDAETGATLWAKQIGRPEHPSMTPGIGRSVLAIVNGSRLYVVNRLNGNILLETDIDGSPGAGPAVSDQRVYVPTVKGLLLAYRIEQLAEALKKLDTEAHLLSEDSTKEKTEDHRDIRLAQKKVKPISCQSKGQTLVQPLVTRETEFEEYVVWPTDEGCLYIGRVDRNADSHIEVKYRLETTAPIIAEPTYLPPDPEISGNSGLVLAASGDGYVYAILEKTGDPLWRFSAGEPLAQPAVVIDERVYAVASLGGLYCIDVKTGKQIWYAPGIFQFIAASKNRVYCADKIGSTRILDAATGAQLDVLPTASLNVKMLNDDTDRIYLADSKGLIQCLHEIGLTKPVSHGEARRRAAEEAAKSSAAQKTPEKTGEEKPAPKKETAAEKIKAGDETEKPAPKDTNKTKTDKDPFAE